MNKPVKIFDPVVRLNIQFNKLMYGRGMQRIHGDRYDYKSGEWKFVQKRYEKGSRLYQMQIDYMYAIKDVVDRGRNPYFVKVAQDLVDGFAKELGVVQE